MTLKERRLAASMLRAYRDDLSNAGCNDWNFPEDWTEQERHDFVRHYHYYNGDPEEFNPSRLILPDFAVAGFLAHLLGSDFS